MILLKATVTGWDSRLGMQVVDGIRDMSYWPSQSGRIAHFYKRAAPHYLNSLCLLLFPPLQILVIDDAVNYETPSGSCQRRVLTPVRSYSTKKAIEVREMQQTSWGESTSTLEISVASVDVPVVVPSEISEFTGTLVWLELCLRKL